MSPENKLVNYIRAKGISLKFCADMLDLEYQTFYQRCYRCSSFKVSEAEKLRLMLNMSDEDFKEIFFDGE